MTTYGYVWFMGIGLEKAIKVEGTATALAKKLKIIRVAQVAKVTSLSICNLPPDFRDNFNELSLSEEAS